MLDRLESPAWDLAHQSEQAPPAQATVARVPAAYHPKVELRSLAPAPTPSPGPLPAPQPHQLTVAVTLQSETVYSSSLLYFTGSIMWAFPSGT